MLNCNQFVEIIFQLWNEWKLIQHQLPKTAEVGVAVFPHTAKTHQSQSSVSENRFYVLDCKDSNTTSETFVLYCCLYHLNKQWTADDGTVWEPCRSCVVLCVDACCLWKCFLLSRTALLSFTDFDLDTCSVSIQSFKCILGCVPTLESNWTGWLSITNHDGKGDA